MPLIVLLDCPCLAAHIFGNVRAPRNEMLSSGGCVLFDACFVVPKNMLLPCVLVVLLDCVSLCCARLLGTCAFLGMGCDYQEGVPSSMCASQCTDACSLTYISVMLLDCMHLGSALAEDMPALGCRHLTLFLLAYYFIFQSFLKFHH